MGAIEALVTGLTDDIKFLKKNRIFFVAGLSIFIYFMALLNITNVSRTELIYSIRGRQRCLIFREESMY